jgi:hypothetical protein
VTNLLIIHRAPLRTWIRRTGGHAFGYATKRLSLTEYDSISKEIILLLTRRYEHIHIPRSVPGKESFGDVDVVVSKRKEEMKIDHDDEDLLLHPLITKRIRNGNTLSIEYKEFQIDIISVKEEELPLSLFFFSFSDVGMIFGMMLSLFSLGFGCHGLFIYLNDSRLLLSKNLDDILLFLQLDKQKWIQGFETEEELFLFIMSSWIFRYSMFQPRKEGQTGKHDQHQKREMFQRFIHFVNQHALEHHENEKEESNLHFQKLEMEIVRREVIKHFRKEEEIAILNEKKEKALCVKAKFNGVLVHEWTGLMNQELGNFMQKFKSAWTTEQLYNFSVEEIRQHVGKFHLVFIHLLPSE